ncbi:hypothetical protein [Solimicrobium silvestre]|uniref:Uncharacterized protein n=1 Tax=Solimicrobium silvestre TaxID=2099400 RepID=A0A2S9GY55_9BURK|nr:hypothetical protein [Solimicrobium silvestre]PRC92630.1 hypothetical protein S2091_2685 [Solimicrobium silvestre]
MNTQITLPERAKVALKSAEHELALIELAAKSADIKEVLNADGRAQAHSAGMALRNTRTSIAATGKAAREDATKFSKAIIEEENRLIALIEPEEKRVLGLRDVWDTKIEAEKQAKIEANRKRISAIQERIAAVKVLPTVLAGTVSSKISESIISLTLKTDFEFFEEFEPEYKLVRSDVINKLTAMETNQREIEVEEDSRRQEEARQKLAQEQESARIKAEQERIAEQQAKERAELDRQRAEQAAIQAGINAKLELEHAALAKLQQEARAEADKLAADKAEFEAKEQAEINATALKQAEMVAAQALVEATAQAEAAATQAACVRLTAIPASCTEKPDQPSDAELLDAIAKRFHVPAKTALIWLSRMDYSSLSIAA